jgi:hypothetical protein
VGLDDDPARRHLSKHLGQPDHWNDAGTDHIR